MKTFKRISLVVAICIAIFVFKKPLTAFAESAGSYINSLKGNWGSSGANSPVMPYVPYDNPDYICQWQIYTNQVFQNGNRQNITKVSWTSFTMDKNNNFFSSKDFNWTVAHVISQNFDDIPLPEEDLVDTFTRDISPVPEMPKQYLSFNFEITDFSVPTPTYEVGANISLEQEIEGLIISGSKNESFARTLDEFRLSTQLRVRKAPNTQSSSEVHPLISSLYCKKRK